MKSDDAVAKVAYFDASALVKRYSEERGTQLVNEVFRLLPNSARACSVITLAEVTAVLVRKRNDGRIPRSLYTEALLEFNREFIDDEDVFISSVDDDLVLESIPLIEIHHINTTDALLLYSALVLRNPAEGDGKDLLFLTSDKRLLRALGAENIPAFDPETDTADDLFRMLELPRPGSD